VFTLVGPDYFPSPADILIDAGGTTGDIASVAKGFRPEDGFTCLPGAKRRLHGVPMGRLLRLGGHTGRAGDLGH